MNPLTLEWVEKAEGDYSSAGRELRARIRPNFDAACFHSHQVAEKYLKAILQEQGQVIPRTHNLIDLIALCLTNDPTFGLLRPDLVALNTYSVRFRYPGATAEKQEAKAAFKSADFVRKFTRTKLGLQE